MANPVTGRETLGSILGAFDKTLKRLDTFIGQQEADKSAALDAAAKQQAKVGTANANIQQAQRTRAKIAELVG